MLDGLRTACTMKSQARPPHTDDPRRSISVDNLRRQELQQGIYNLEVRKARVDPELSEEFFDPV